MLPKHSSATTDAAALAVRLLDVYRLLNLAYICKVDKQLDSQLLAGSFVYSNSVMYKVVGEG